MAIVTQAHCLKALDLYSESLMLLPNVQGLGVGPPPAGSSEIQCCVFVYLISEIGVNLPSHLDVPVEGGGVVQVPVQAEVQGLLHLE